jgi:pimeloyl-ACP methyl ester carboxylesterase
VLRRIDSPDGVPIACEVGGRGPPLVLVHGAGSGRWGFDELRPLLEQAFTVTAMDRRGRGESGDGEAHYSIEDEFADVAAVVAAAGEGAALFGHSYGGLVAAGAASRLPRLERLALYEPPMGGVLADDELIDRWERLIQAGERDLMVREFFREVAGFPEDEIDELAGSPVWERRKRVSPTVPRELRAEGAFRLDPDGLAQLEMPTLMLLGSESPDWARRSMNAYSEAIPNAEIRILQGHGHGATTSGPELLAAEVARFLSG